MTVYECKPCDYVTTKKANYDRHLESAKEILFRSPLEQQPKISLHDKKDFYQVSIKDFTIENVESIKKLSEDLEIAI